MKSILFVGMDVHKNSFNLCCYNSNTGEYIEERRCAAVASNVEKFINDVKAKYPEEELDFKCGYEAGCLGFYLYKQLKARNIDCDILAPTSMQTSAKNKVIKNDRMDARNIALNLANKSYSAVHIPKKEDLKVREYIRMMTSFKKSLKKVKQYINAYLLRYGFHYDGKSKWTEAHIKWIKSLDMEDLFKEVLDEYMLEYDHLVDVIGRFTAKLNEIYQSEKYINMVSKLRCFKGIDTLSGMIIHVETSGFDRFPSAKAYSSYVGLGNGEHSSGEKNNRTGSTKMGNRTLRTTFVECAQALVKGNVYGAKSKALKARQAGQSGETIAYADKATKRLMKKYRSLINRNVPHNKAIVAVARELACFVWGMENEKVC